METALLAAIASTVTLILRELFAGLSALRDKDIQKEKKERAEYETRMNTYCQELKKDNDEMHKMIVDCIREKPVS